LSTTEQRTWEYQHYQYGSCYYFKFNSIAKEGTIPNNSLHVAILISNKCQGDHSLNNKPLLKRQAFAIQDERPLKIQVLVPRRDNNNCDCAGDMGRVRQEIASIKETLEELAFEVREERDNLHSVLADILAEVQEWD